MIGEPLRSLTFGLLSNQFHTTEFRSVAHVGSSARTQIDLIANLNDA